MTLTTLVLPESLLKLFTLDTVVFITCVSTFELYEPTVLLLLMFVVLLVTLEIFWARAFDALAA